jgi:GntR family transcriptional repressor for pyruvate dehydrogenase complex
MGVLETRERLGVFIKVPELKNLSENMRLMPFWPEKFLPQFLEVRLIIDVHAAELAAQRRTDEQLNQMKECLETLNNIPLSTLAGVKAQAHYEYLFHNLVVESAHNAILSKIWEGLVFLIEKNNEIIHESLTEDENWAPRVSSHHKTTLLAIENMDPIGAANSMKIHLMETRERYLSKQNKRELRYPFGEI